MFTCVLPIHKQKLLVWCYGCAGVRLAGAPSFAVLSVQIAQSREDLLCNRARQTESWPDRIMPRERREGQSSMILSGHDSVFFHLVAALPLGDFAPLR
jgi:hypothetical protein